VSHEARPGRIRRLAAEGPFVVGAALALDETSARHARVLRLPERAEVELFDGRGQLARARLGWRGRSLLAEVESAWEAPPPPPVVLLQAIAKGDKLDAVVRMATEIGVRRIALVQTERAVADPDRRRRERWDRIAREAARQSEQAWTPEILGPNPLLAAAAAAPEGARRLVLAARGEPRPPPQDGTETWLVIGPEGGLTEQEEQALVRLGYRPWTLPTGILRTETAAAVALGALLE
jgi:16S rRNA (uracil1498-N3)-methyltransferase